MEQLKNYEGLVEKGLEMLMSYGPKVLLALITLVLGLFIISRFVRVFAKTMANRNFDASLTQFLLSLTSISLKALLIISVASMVGIQTTSFVAVMGAAGLAVGLSLQGSLSNFAGGVLILIFRPIKVGDFIEAQGHAGVVSAIQVFCTILKTGDNKTVIIPNGPLAGGSITNYSTEATRRVDMVFGIGYDDDIKKAKELLTQIFENDERVLKDPAPLVVVSELADSSVNFTVRPWVNSADYWGVYFDTQETVKLEFDKAGISIPYPQQDVHMHQK